MSKKIEVYWSDIKVYNDESWNVPTPAVTVGEVVLETSNYIVLKNPETLLLDPVRNHPERQPNFYYLPKSLITKISPINGEKN